MEYSLKTLEKSILKGVIGEHLARSFIRRKLAPELAKEEGWHYVLLSNNDYKLHSKTRNRKLFSFEPFKTDFIQQGFYASQQEASSKIRRGRRNTRTEPLHS